MVICNCIKSQLSYVIVAQRKEYICTYICVFSYFMFISVFKTLCKHFKHTIKILFWANFVCIKKSS